MVGNAASKSLSSTHPRKENEKTNRQGKQSEKKKQIKKTEKKTKWSVASFRIAMSLSAILIDALFRESGTTKSADGLTRE